MHENHRRRSLESFLSEGIESKPPHIVLEYLLYYSIPRRDTNELAHRLIDRFGSLSGVLDADYHDLLAVDGIGEYSATYLKLLQSTIAYYGIDKNYNGRPKLNSVSKIGRFLCDQYRTDTVEVARVLLLDAQFRLIACERLTTGTVNSTPMTSRAVINSVISHSASMVVLAHNHPGGKAIPSENDKLVTEHIRRAMYYVDVRLLEHFVIAGSDYVPIISQMPDNWQNAEKHDAMYQFYSGLEIDE